MSNSIDLIITPIKQATTAILDTIKETFLSNLENKFLSSLIKSELQSFISELNSDLYCLIEYPYVDKVYRDSYYHYYATKHYSYNRDCIRVSLFQSKIELNDFINPAQHFKLNEYYVGFFIIRPTKSATIGRSFINPKAFKISDFQLCLCKIESLVFGVKLQTEGFPHSSQDEETIKCAETTVWGVMEYFGNKYPEYSPVLPSQIHKSLRHLSSQRQMPSNGLTMDQISFSLKEFGFGTRVYSKEGYGDDFFSIINTYIESGIPIVIGLESSHFGHAVVAIGKKESHYDWGKVIQKSYSGFRRKVKYYDSSDLPAKFVFQDDNLQPYRTASLDTPGEQYTDAGCTSYEIDSVVVPLYSKIYLEAFVAKGLALQILHDKLLGYQYTDGFVFRLFLASSRTFKNHISKQDDIDQSIKLNLLLSKMPKFIWCAEIYSKENYIEKRVAKGLIILDATEADNESVDAFIFAGYPDRCMLMCENNFISLPTPFENYNYFSNLK